MTTMPRRALQELSALQASVQTLGGHRNVALRLFAASRRSTIATAQQEFWLEFSWLDQEYRNAVRRLAEFCRQHSNGLPGSLRAA